MGLILSIFIDINTVKASVRRNFDLPKLKIVYSQNGHYATTNKEVNRKNVFAS